MFLGFHSVFKGFLQQSLWDLEALRPLSSVLLLHSGHYSLGAFGPLNPIWTLESASNYYNSTIQILYRSTYYANNKGALCNYREL